MKSNQFKSLMSLRTAILLVVTIVSIAGGNIVYASELTGENSAYEESIIIPNDETILESKEVSDNEDKLTVNNLDVFDVATDKKSDIEVSLARINDENAINGIALANVYNETGTIKLSNPSSSLNIRSGSSTSTSILGTLSHGTVVDIIGNENGWYKIKYNGITGYVKDNYVAVNTKTVQETPVVETTKQTGTIKLSDPSSSLNIRSGSSTSTSILGTLSHGTVVDIIGNENGWYKIKYNGITGFVKDNFVTVNAKVTQEKPVEEVPVVEVPVEKPKTETGTIKLSNASSSLNIRSGSSTSTRILGSLSHGTVVTILGSENGWYKISYNGITGYVKDDYVAVGSPVVDTTVYGRIKLSNASSSLNIRSGSSTSSSILGSLSHGTVVTILGSENGWYKIKYNGITGFVKDNYVTVDNSSYKTVNEDSAKYQSTIIEGVRYYAQDDDRYGHLIYSTLSTSNKEYTSQTMKNSACGPTALSIVVSTLLDRDISAVEMSQFSIKNGFRPSSGTYSSIFTSGAKSFGLNGTRYSSLASFKTAINNGNCMGVALVRAGNLTKGGHFVVVAGVKNIDGKDYYKIYDPNSGNPNYVGNQFASNAIASGDIKQQQKGLIYVSESLIQKQYSELYIIRR